MSHPLLRRTLGPNVKAAREAAGLTQLALAHLLGHEGPDAGAYVSRVEAGHLEPRLGTLRRIATALKVDLDTLLGSRKH